jgi:uncharacterized membrane protein (DUF2068 family)
MSKEISAEADALAKVCEYLSDDLGPLADRLRKCVESEELPCATAALDRLRQAIRASAQTIQVATGLQITRAVSGLVLLTIALFLMLTPLSELDLEVAPVVVGLSIASLALYANIWSSAISLVGAMILLPLEVVEAEGSFLAALTIISAVNVLVLLLELYLRRITRRALRNQVTI